MKVAPKPSAKMPTEAAATFHRQMVLIRTFEANLTRLSQLGELRGSLHLAAGQEACPVGACSVLNDDDALTMTYRGHGYALAKGCDLHQVMAEILGRTTGLCKGRGGKMHLMDLKHGLLGANGIVAGGIGTAAGAALASKMDGTKRVALTVFGDGTVNQGHAHEVMNMAGLWKLPIIFLCENNLYAEMTPLARSTAVTDLREKMKAYGIEAVRCDGNDVFAVQETMEEAVKRARSGEGPTFIEAMTYRTVGHYQADAGTSYRTAEEIAEWKEKDPILRLEKAMGMSEAERERVRAEVQSEIIAAIDAALAAPEPSADDLAMGVFSS